MIDFLGAVYNGLAEQWEFGPGPKSESGAIVWGKLACSVMCDGRGDLFEICFFLLLLHDI